MAGVAGDSTGVVCGHNLRKPLRLGAVGFMTAGADESRVQLGRGDGCGIVGMLGLRAVAGLACHHHMFALLFLLDNVGMAGFADCVAGKSSRPGCGLRDGSAAVVTVLAKAARNDCDPQNQEYGQQYYDDHRKSDQMFYVLEQFRFPTPEPWLVILSTNQALYFDTWDSFPKR